MGNSKTPYKSSDHVNRHDVTLGGLINASYHQFYFCSSPNGPSNNDIIDEDHHTDNYGYNYMIIPKLSKRDKVSPEDIRKLLSIPNPYYTQYMKDINIDRKLYV